jgi:L-2-amino-thiazoline-4-carboxylic acid hydrolase
MTTEDLEQELRAANADRAILYFLVFDELRRIRGEAEATNVMRAAIYRLGQEMAASIKQFAPDRIKSLGEYHVAHSAGGGRLFNPEVKRLDDKGFEVLNTTCPLKDAWQAYGLPDAEVAKMCEIGSVIDYGKFEGAGFRFECDTWKPGKRGCCTLKAYPRK